MSYRNDVAIITTKEAWGRIKQAVGKTQAEGGHLIRQASMSPLRDGKYILAEWAGVSWVEAPRFGSPAVRAVMDTLKKLDVEYVPYQYLRIGEDWEDYDYMHQETEDWRDCADMPTLSMERKIDILY